MTDNGTYIIGVSGRSGSGKTTLVKKLADKLSPHISVHTMDNYYLPRPDQLKDEEGYLNFDLPSSFYREKFHEDLVKLKKGESIKLPKYDFNNTGVTGYMHIPPAPIIIVEGLFIYHYEEVSNMMDYRVMVSTELNNCYDRRLHRDQTERNYKETEINYRYNQHAEPAFQSYILPYWDDCDMIINNTRHMKEGIDVLIEMIAQKINL